jgi:hypothetical protein
VPKPLPEAIQPMLLLAAKSGIGAGEAPSADPSAPALQIRPIKTAPQIKNFGLP